jgi:hypothetical protein
MISEVSSVVQPNTDSTSTSKSMLQRANSLTISKQSSGTCFAHSTARVLTRLIKIFCKQYFNSNVLEKCSYYYKEHCAINPFECFDKNLKNYNLYNSKPNRLDVFNFSKSGAQDYFKKYPSCLGNPETRDETGNLKENISAALYSYIYITITSKYGCDGGFPGGIITDFLDNNLNSETSIENVAFTLNFAKPCNESTCFPVVQSAKQIESVLKNPYVKFVCETICNILNFMKDKKKLYDDIFVDFISRQDDDELFEKKITYFKELLNFGYYGELSIKTKNGSHAIVITSYEDVIINGLITDTIFIVKNSWGENPMFSLEGIRHEKGVLKIPLSFLIPRIKNSEADITYITIIKKANIPSEVQTESSKSNGQTSEKSNSGGYKKKRRTIQQKTLRLRKKIMSIPKKRKCEKRKTYRN